MALKSILFFVTNNLMLGFWLITTFVTSLIRIKKKKEKKRKIENPVKETYKIPFKILATKGNKLILQRSA